MDNVNPVVTAICQLVKGTLPLRVWYGRGQFGRDAAQTTRTLIGLGSNPNVAAALVVSLEPVSGHQVADAIAATGKPVELITVQEAGGSLNAVCEGARAAARMVIEASRLRREKVGVDHLVIGVECGGSDTTSGIAANPCVGVVSDWIVDAGGVVLLSETSEFMGAEHLLARRAVSPEVAAKIIAAVGRIEEDAMRRGVDIRGANPVPDNIRGGLTTIEEKSLGAIAKGGSRPIMDVLEYAQSPRGKGLFIMDTPAPACESMTGLTAGGATLILFATGVGNPIGDLISPTIKISANPLTVAKLADNVDFDASSVITGAETLEGAAMRLMREALEVASGKLTKAEVLGQQEIAISRIEPTV
jgi:altronate dehydratase large subunit